MGEQFFIGFSRTSPFLNNNKTAPRFLSVADIKPNREKKPSPKEQENGQLFLTYEQQQV